MTPEPKPIPREIDDRTLAAVADAQAAYASILPIKLLATRSKPQPPTKAQVKRWGKRK